MSLNNDFDEDYFDEEDYEYEDDYDKEDEILTDEDFEEQQEYLENHGYEDDYDEDEEDDDMMDSLFPNDDDLDEALEHNLDKY